MRSTRLDETLRVCSPTLLCQQCMQGPTEVQVGALPICWISLCYEMSPCTSHSEPTASSQDEGHLYQTPPPYCTNTQTSHPDTRIVRRLAGGIDQSSGLSTEMRSFERFSICFRRVNAIEDGRLGNRGGARHLLVYIYDTRLWITLAKEGTGENYHSLVADNRN